MTPSKSRRVEMTGHSLFTKQFLIVFVIFLANICENHAYSPPAATVEPLYPTGLRISVPDEQGITLVAFHVKFNEDFDGLEAGSIAKDILKIRNGRWTYEDRNTILKRDDVIYYWVHVVYQGLGYNLIDQSYRVVDFYNPDGTLPVTNKIRHNCTTKSTTWFFDKNGTRQQACPRELLFEENFDTLDSTNWNMNQRFAGPPYYEFVIYMTSDVTDVSDGRLRIRPILTNDKFGKNFVTQQSLTLPHCTGQVGTKECYGQANGAFILPPVISGFLDTKGKFEFLFGRIEIRAKLPLGDWVYPLITLRSSESEHEHDMYREIRIASSVGNEELRTATGKNIGGRILRAGGLITVVNDRNATSSSSSNLPIRQSGKPWSDDYHIFEVEWKSGLIVVKVDNVQYGEQIVDGVFGKRSYLTLGLAVAGIHEFDDHSVSSGYVKPWRDVEANALYNFYFAKNSWYPTWQVKTALEVDYVKVWSL